MVKMTKTNKDAYKAAGMILEEIKFLNSGPVVASGNELQCLVTFSYVLNINDHRYGGENYLLALSDDKGESWTFVELETYDEGSIRDFIPGFSDQLIFPTIKGAELLRQ